MIEVRFRVKGCIVVPPVRRLFAHKTLGHGALLGMWLFQPGNIKDLHSMFLAG